MDKITAYLSLGSNVGDRLDYLDAAKEKLKSNPAIKVTAESKIYETEPWSVAGHPHSESGMDWFLNQVVKIQTSLKPMELLSVLEGIEKDLGRTAKGYLKPREIDIDILLYNDEVIDLFDKNLLSLEGSIRNAVLYVKEILTTKCRVLL